jgi:integrase
VQTILGHTDETTTRGYQHVDLSLARAALSNLNGLLVIDAP